ncbi:MAG TPA: TetR/AcrR family transcriptional regulator [Candidatus Angelobacter sp.]|nr:TetR/AcrR family transcriptional regulator [Candidatus Angelobacter sp.]
MLVAHERKRKFRDPERTRERLLQAAFREIHRSGFQSASIDMILAATNVTKGALYHHFESKEALGYAVVEEKIAKLTRDRWLLPMLSDGQAIDILIGVVRRIPARPQDVRAGCPLLLLAQEMSPLDEQFRRRLERIFLDWQEGIATLLRKGQSQGTVRRDLNPDEAASFLIATVEGYATLAKNAQDAKVWRAGIRNIVGWLKSLQASRQSQRGGRRMLKKHVFRQRQRFELRRKR